MTTENPALELEELAIRTSQEGEVSNIAWTGLCEVQDPEVTIGPFLRGLIPSLVNRKVVMDFRKLEYMNSATMQPLFLLLKELNTNQIQTTILYDPGTEWQRISFRSIKAVTTTLPCITVTAG
jgi:hypothetical protein